MKIKYLFYSFVLLILFTPMVYAKSNVEIISVKKDETALKGNVIEKSDPVTNGLKVGFNISFDTKNDSIKYIIKIKNNSNNNYVLNLNNTSNDKYIKYTIDYGDRSKTLTKNSVKDIFVTISYSNEIPKNFFGSKTSYTSNIPIQLSLRDKDVSNNPNTGINKYLIIILSVIILLSLTIGIRKKKKIYALLLVITTILILTNVNAAEKNTITLNSNVEILKKQSIYYIIYGYIREDETDKYNLVREYNFINKRYVDSCKQNEYTTYKNHRYLHCTIGVKTDEIAIGKEAKTRELLRYPDDILMFDNTKCTGNYNDRTCADDAAYDSFTIGYVYEEYCEPFLVYYKEYNTDYFDMDSNNRIFKVDGYGLDTDNPQEQISNYGGFLLLTPPNKFIMPNHDLYFIESLYSRCI